MKSEYHKCVDANGCIMYEWWGEELGDPDLRILQAVRTYHRLDGPALVCRHKDGSEQRYYYILDYEVNVADYETPGFVDAFILEHS